MNPHNLHNAKIYAENSAAAANFLATSQVVQSALRHWIEKFVSTNPIRILELGSSSRLDRWQIISRQTTRTYDVVLSDFTLSALPQDLPSTDQMKLRAIQLDLLKDKFPKYPFNLILATYVFDAIWFPQDQYMNHIHYPGGLIAKVQEAFSTCLDRTGIFMSIDRTSTKFVPEYEMSGPARFKTENYELAKQALSGHGFRADVLNLNHFLELAGTRLPLDLSDHSVLIVTNS